MIDINTAEDDDLQLPFMDAARAWLEEHLEEGATCPCCGQFAKRYARTLNATMAAGLCWLSRRAEDWTHVPSQGPRWLVRAAGEFAKLAHWEFIEQCPKGKGVAQKRTSGIWRITPAGRLFAEGAMTAPEKVYIYNNQVMGWSSTRTTIMQALDTHFDYEQLMLEVQ